MLTAITLTGVGSAWHEEGLVRLSVGLEGAPDILADIAQALDLAR